jgi:DNA-binding transcriptional LysR family regulator
VPAAWPERTLAELGHRPFVLEPTGTAARDWSTATCRAAGFEPDVQHVSTDLQIHLTLVAYGLAAALVPDLAGAAGRDGVSVHALPGAPARSVFAAVRLGAIDHPTTATFTDALVAAFEAATVKEH